MNVRQLRRALRGVADTLEVTVRVFDFVDADCDYIGTPYHAGVAEGCAGDDGEPQVFFAIDCMPGVEDEPPTHLRVVK